MMHLKISFNFKQKFTPKPYKMLRVKIRLLGALIKIAPKKVLWAGFSTRERDDANTVPKESWAGFFTRQRHDARNALAGKNIENIIPKPLDGPVYRGF